MLFNSPEFLLLFLPATLLMFHGLRAAARPLAALAALLAASLFFYGWWNPSYLALLVLSVTANFGLGRLVVAVPPGSRLRWLVVAAGIGSVVGSLNASNTRSARSPGPPASSCNARRNAAMRKSSPPSARSQRSRKAARSISLCRASTK